jgi:hypothetical protein
MNRVCPHYGSTGSEHVTTSPETRSNCNETKLLQFRRVDPHVINSAAATGHPLLPETFYPLVLHDSACHFRLAVLVLFQQGSKSSYLKCKACSL